MAAAGTCTSHWYCPPSTLVATQRQWRDTKYSFVQVSCVFGVELIIGLGLGLGLCG